MKITKEKVVHSHSPGVPSCFWVTMPTLPVLEITSVVYLAGNPLWSGSQWSPNKQSQSSPWRQCRICSETPDTIYPSSSKKIRLSKFKTKKKKSSFGKIIKGHFIFITWALSRWRVWKQRPSNEWRGFGWIWWGPFERGSE